MTTPDGAMIEYDANNRMKTRLETGGGTGPQPQARRQPQNGPLGADLKTGRFLGVFFDGCTCRRLAGNAELGAQRGVAGPIRLLVMEREHPRLP